MVKKIKLILFLSLLTGLFSYSLFNEQNQTAHAATDAANADTYYASLYDNSGNLKYKGDELLSRLNTIISTNTTNKSYDELDDVYKTSDVDPNDSSKVISYYTGQSISFDFDGFDSTKGGINREHVWCQSHFGKETNSQTSPYSDAHQVRPSEVSINSSRNNSYFSELDSWTKSDDYGNKWTGDIFYPNENYRGDVARICFYVATRYTNLTFVDGATTIPSGNNYQMGNISSLMKWNILYGVSASEVQRQEAVAKIQNNRNPFIDHPEYAVYIWEDFNDTTKEIVDTYTYDITFNTNGGSTLDTQKVLYNYTINEPIAPTKEGTSFVGWYSDSALTKEYDFSSKVTSDMTLYAKWGDGSTGENTGSGGNTGGDVSNIDLSNSSITTALSFSYESTINEGGTLDFNAKHTSYTNYGASEGRTNFRYSNTEVATTDLSAFGVTSIVKGYKAAYSSDGSFDNTPVDHIFKLGTSSVAGSITLDNARYNATKVKVCISGWSSSENKITLSNAKYNNATTITTSATEFKEYELSIIDVNENITLTASKRAFVGKISFTCDSYTSYKFDDYMLRFKTSIAKDVLDSINAVSYGALMNLSSNHPIYEDVTIEEFNSLYSSPLYLNIPISSEQILSDESNYIFTAALTNIPEAQLNTNVIVVFYVLTEDNAYFTSSSTNSISGMVDKYLTQSSSLGLSALEIELLNALDKQIG